MAGKKDIVEQALKLITGGEPQKTVKAYKLFRQKEGKLYPLFVDANEEVALGQWLKAKAGEQAASGKVKSKLGELAYRPGWHAGDLPIATHIGARSHKDPKLPPDTRPSEQVWAEVEMADDVDWQKVANERARITKKGTPDPKTAQITDQVPYGGYYRYKTNPNMTGNWMIGGDMRVNRVLTDDEVKAINDAAGVADLPRREGYGPGGWVDDVVKMAGKAIMGEGDDAAKAAGIIPGTFPGKRLPNVDALARNVDKFVYHSGVAEDIPSMKYGVDPQIGPWVQEVLNSATDEDDLLREIQENAVPVSWWSKRPNWAVVKVARKLGKNPGDVTPEELAQHGHVALIPKKDPEAESMYWIGEQGLSSGPYSEVEDITGRKLKAYETDLYSGNYGPEGVERNEYITPRTVEPYLHLTGDELLDFLRKTGAYNKAYGGRIAKGGGGGFLDDALKMAGKAIFGEGEDAAKAGIRAYQGSPHNFAAERLVRFPEGRTEYIVGQPDVLPDVPEGAEVVQDFPLGRMRMDKIGTGEGAQAYGHGLYFAENEGIARSYRDKLAQQWQSYVDGKRASELGQPIWEVADQIASRGMTPEQFLQHRLDAIETAKAAGNENRANIAAEILAEERPSIEALMGKSVKKGPGGHMYEVNIAANPEQFLDWDKPLSEQSEAVKNAFRSMDIADESVWPNITANDAYEMLRVDSMGDDAFLRDQAYRLARRAEAGAGASRMLREAGIPGIKYLDAGSRGAGDGTRNYVVFDDKLISIIRKYGIAGASAMLGYNLMEQLDPKQALAASMADQDYQASIPNKAYGGEVDDDIHDALRIAKDIGGSTSAPVMMEDAKGNKYDAQGNVIPPTNSGPNPARSDVTPQSVAAKAVNDPATYDALMERYAIPDRDIAEYEALKTAVSQQPQDIQQMTHVGDRPRREMTIDMPLFGGEYSMGTAPYDVAQGLQGAAQTAYDFKTMPAYFFPATAPFALGADVLESRLADDPLGFVLNAAFTPQGASAAKSVGRSVLDLVRSNPKATAAAVGAGAYLSPDEAEAGPERWFSKAMEVARALPMEKMTGQQALAMLRKGVSPEELRWTGADAFLPQQKQITKQDLVDYLAKNRVKTQDVVFGGAKPVRRGDIVPSETAIAPYKERWDELVAQNRAINEVMLLPPSERDADIDDLLAQRNDIQYEMDQIHDKAVDATIEEMGGLRQPLRYGPGSSYGEQYVTPGGTDYRETLITLPEDLPSKERKLAELDAEATRLERAGDPRWRDVSRERGELLRSQGRSIYSSGHWEGVPNVMAHIRTQVLDVTPPGANRPYKAFNVDEAQSDLAQSGRKQGFSDPEINQRIQQIAKERVALNDQYTKLKSNIADEYEAGVSGIERAYDMQDAALFKRLEKREITQREYEALLGELMDSHREAVRPYREKMKGREINEVTPISNKLDELARNLQQLNAEKTKPPLMPYVGNTQGWTDLSIKKALDQAMDAGADYFTYTPGEVQASRYDLSKQIKSLSYDPSTQELKYLPVDATGDDYTFGSGIPPEKLPNYVGREITEKLLSTPGDKYGVKSLGGLDLKVGGEGMIDYYNNIYKKRVEKVVKDATGKKVQWEVIPVQTADGPREQLGFRLTDDMKEARFSDFNKGGRVADPVVNKALALTRY